MFAMCRPADKQGIPDRWSDDTERALRSRFQVTLRNFLKFFARGSGGA